MKGRFFVSFSGLLNHLLASQVTASFVFITPTIIGTSSWPILVVLEVFFFMGDGFQAESYTYMLTWCHIKLLLVWLVLIDGFDGGSGAMHLHSISWNIGCCRFLLRRWCEIEQDNSSLPLVVPHDCADQVWLYSDLLAVQWFLVDLVFKWLVLLLVWQCKQKHSHGIVVPVVAVLCRW